jgi:Coenzyme PQQ synthesis protein D (PqqD)
MEQMLRLDETAMSWQETDDGVVVLNLATSRYLVINDSGKVLWERLLEGATRSELAEHLVTVYEIETPVAAADVDDFVADLTACGLLVAP